MVHRKYSRQALYNKIRALNPRKTRIYAKKTLPLFKPERKMLDFSVVDQPIDTAGSQLLLNGCHLGDNYSTRDGKQIYLKDINFIMSLQSTPTTGVAQHAMVALIDWYNPHGVMPSITDVYTWYDDTTKQDSLGNFRILKKWIVTLSDSLNTGSRHIINLKYKKLNIPVMYNTADTGLIDDIEKHAIYILVYGSQTPSTNAGKFTVRGRINFYEK